MASLNQRNGLLGKRLAAHLLRRTTYMVTPTRIQAFAAKTATQAVDELFTIPPLTEPNGPINYEDGTSFWLTTHPYANGPSSLFKSVRSVLLWFYNELLNDVSIRQKMTIFYSGIFVTAEETDWEIFEYFRLLQHYAIGNVKELSHKITLDNRMLKYLNNNQNNKWNPNENYAREYLELFTILKGPQISAGNYTNYTEHDIQQASKVLSGFRDAAFSNKDPQTGLATGYADYNHHETSNKQFSAAFQNKVIMGATSEPDMWREYQEFVDMIFDQLETARAFVRRLYLYFVSDNISAEVEQDIIEQLAIQLWNNGYEVEPVLKKLLKSVHFYDEDDSDNTDEIIGGKVKSPLELYLTTINLFNANNLGSISADPNNYNIYANGVVEGTLEIMGFPEFALSVEGYPGFFKGPSFSKFWVDTSTIGQRYKMAQALLNGTSVKSQWQNLPFQVDIVSYFDSTFVNQEYATHLLDQLLELLLPEMPDANRRSYFLDKLTAGVNANNWMFEWLNFKATNDDSAVRIVLEDLFEALVASPEFQTF